MALGTATTASPLAASWNVDQHDGESNVRRRRPQSPAASVRPRHESAHQAGKDSCHMLPAGVDDVANAGRARFCCMFSQLFFEARSTAMYPAGRANARAANRAASERAASTIGAAGVRLAAGAGDVRRIRNGRASRSVNCLPGSSGFTGVVGADGGCPESEAPGGTRASGPGWRPASVSCWSSASSWTCLAGWLRFRATWRCVGRSGKAGEPGDQISPTNGAGGMTADILGVPRTRLHYVAERYRGPSIYHREC